MSFARDKGEERSDNQPEDETQKSKDNEREVQLAENIVKANRLGV